MKALHEIAGQILTVGIEGQLVSPECSELLTSLRPGGVIFFHHNIATADQFSNLVSQGRELPHSSPPFLAIDLEGGTVDRFRELIAPLPSVAATVAAGAARELGRVAGRELAAFDLNVDYAPVLDLGLPASREVLTSRTAGASPAAVIAFAREFLSGLAEEGIIGCGKHFPGLGGGNLDSHMKMPAIARTHAKMWSDDLAPYRELAEQLPMVMVAHAWYPELERELGYAGEPRPASLSPVIVGDLLRKRIGYTGLILCDDLEMGGVLGERTIEQAALGAVEAGCDTLLVCRHPDNVQRVHAALVKQCESSGDFRAKVEAAAGRNVALKQRHDIRRRPTTTRPTVQQLREQIARLTEFIQAKFA